MNFQVVTRRNDFVKKVDDYAALNIYGLNVVSTEGVNWQRHRKITGPPFNEKNSRFVSLFLFSIHSQIWILRDEK